MATRSRPLGRALAAIRPRPRPGSAVRSWYPPVRRYEFWLIQLFVVAAALLDWAFERSGVLEAVGPAYVFSVALLFVPVTYAAVSFGIRGSLPTAIWCVIVVLPDMILDPQFSTRLGKIWELGLVVILGVFVGLRVDREVDARIEAERREQERLASEERYRSLFEGAPAPILIADAQGIVQEANEGVAVLVGESADDLPGRHLATVVGDEIAAMILGHEEPSAVNLQSKRLGSVWLLPAGIPYAGADGRSRIQVILRDVTPLEERRRGIEAYARRTVAGREEEQRRIARELHDGPLQSVIMLSRRLTAIQPPESVDGRRDLAEVSALATSVADELRRTSRNLRPAILDDLGLAAALRSEGDLVARQHGIAVRFRLAGQPRPLSAATDLMLLRVTQEALRNVVRHAAASNVVIGLTYRPAAVKLSVADDGVGPGRRLATQDLLADGKLGIVGMIERANLLGASCRIYPNRNGGTLVQVLVRSDNSRRRQRVPVRGA